MDKFLTMFAIVTLVMRGDRYVPGALAFAYSTKKYMPEDVRDQVDVICMVTDDVSIMARQQLTQWFDRVILVPYITYPHSFVSTKLFQEKYASWIKQSVTKWNCLGFHEYQRVGFFDADCLIMQDITGALMNETYKKHVAGCFSNAWSETCGLTNGMLDFYAPYISQRNPERSPIIPIIALHRAFHNQQQRMSFVCAGSSIFFTPYKDAQLDFISFVQQDSEARISTLSCGGSGPDDQLIVKFLLHRHPIHKAQKFWQHLHAGWCFIPWKPQLLIAQGLIDPRDVFVRHSFNIQKPWEMERNLYPDLLEWYEAYDSAVMGLKPVGLRPHTTLEADGEEKKS
jgi:hypothetical protein